MFHSHIRNLAVTSVIALLIFSFVQCSNQENPADSDTNTEITGDPTGDTGYDSTADTTGDTTSNDTTPDDTTGDTTGNDTTGNDTTGDTTGLSLVADHYSVARFDSLTSSEIASVSSGLRIFYGHTSHGSQIMTGLSMIDAEDATYDPPVFHEISDDLGGNGDITWVQPTRDFLDTHSDYNVVMWSWCGGCSDNTVEGINTYLQAMTQLETDYPDVIFIYMTGHLDGTGIDGTLYACNNQIRDYCAANDKVLFDFADIESYDPDGNYYPNETDACEWAVDWCATHDCPACDYCAHSHCFNCYLKGKAMWWLMSRLVQ